MGQPQKCDIKEKMQVREYVHDAIIYLILICILDI